MATAPTPAVVSTTPVITEAMYHPDHPGPTGWLIQALHERLLAIETKLGMATPSAAATSFVKTAETDVVSVATAAEADAASIIHKLEGLLHLPQG